MFKAITKFLHEARVELLRVSWPSRQTAINLTLTVIIITVISSIFIGAVDLLLTEGLKGLTALDLGGSESVTPQSQPVDIEVGDIETTPVN